jgi:hypothetical protein
MALGARQSLITEPSSSRLVLAIEPECACLATEKDTKGFLSVNDQFMVLDCGGGTVDITMHRSLSKEPFRLQELARPEGGDWGSTYVDEQFGAFMSKLLGAGRFADLKKTASYLELMVRQCRALACGTLRTREPRRRCRLTLCACRNFGRRSRLACALGSWTRKACRWRRCWTFLKS